MLLNNILKNTGRLCVLGVIVAGPWRNGAFEPLYLRALIFLTIASAVLALATLWTTPSRERKLNSYWSTILIAVPLLLGLGLGVIQAVPLSDSVLAKFSPRILEMRELILPPETTLDLDAIHDENGSALFREESAGLAELSEKTRVFNGLVIPYDDDESPDFAESLLIDAAVENTFLPKDKRGLLEEWGHTISVSPVLTRQILPMFWAAFLLFLSSSVLFNTPASRIVLFKTVVFTGFVFALACVALKANPDSLDCEKYNYWWLTDAQSLTVTEGSSFGTYVNKNAAGGYLVLCFCICLFFVAHEFMSVARMMNKERRHEPLKEGEDSIYEKTREPLWKVILGDFFELFNRRLAFWLGVLGFLYAAILASLSRGASVAATLALLWMFIFVSGRKETRRFWYVPLATFVVAVASLVGVCMYDNVDERMSTMIEEDVQGQTAIERDSRWKNWEGALEGSRDYPWFGSGLGTYRIADYPYDKATSRGVIFRYAENSFVQTLLEMGRVGAILFILVYVLLLGVLGRFLNGSHSVETTAFAIAGTSLLVGQIISSSVDFGIYLPANLFLFSLLCGACVGRQNRHLFESLNKASLDRGKATNAFRKINGLERSERLGLLVFSIILLATTALGVAPALRENADYNARRNLLKRVDIPEERFCDMAPSSIDGLIRDLRNFTLHRDDSEDVRGALAKLEIVRFRLQYGAFLKENQQDASPERIWEQTQPERFLTFFLDSQWSGLRIPTERTRNNSFILESFPEAVADLLAARRILPLNARNYSSLLALLPLCSDMTWEEERELAELYMRRAASLGPFDCNNLLVSGYRLGAFKLWGLEQRFLRKTAENNPQYSPEILKILGDSMPDTVLKSILQEAVPDDPQGLCLATVSLFGRKETHVYKAMEQKARKYFTEAPDEERDAYFYFWAGRFYSSMKEYELAQEMLGKAYELDSTNDDAFFLRAQILCDHSSLLEKDKECVEMLEEYCKSHRGQKNWRASELLEKARTNLKRNNAREDARARILKEREQDERIKKEIREERNMSNVDVNDVSKSDMRSDDDRSESSNDEVFDNN